MKAKILVLIGILFLISITAGLITPVKEVQEIEENNPDLEEIMGLGWPYYLCSGEYNDAGMGQYYYNGNKLTEAGGNCNASIRLYSWLGDLNIAFEPILFFKITDPIGQFRVNSYYPDLTFPPTWREGSYVEVPFNWDFQPDYCFAESYTTRHKTGTIEGEPTFGTGEDWSYIYTWFLDGDTRNTITDVDYHIPIENVNRPLINVQTDQENYFVPYGQETFEVTITITDQDLNCGDVNWHSMMMQYPIYYREEGLSAETFEIRVNGQALPTETDFTWPYTGPAGSFGITLTGANTGEITVELDANALGTGEHDLNLTVFDTDGLYESATGPFLVEEYGSQIDKTIHVTIEGPPAVCGDADGDKAVNVGDVVYLIDYVFKNGEPPEPLWTGDADGNGAVNVGDVVYLIGYVFKNGPAPDCQIW